MNSSHEIQLIAYQEHLVRAARLFYFVDRTTKAINPLLEFDSREAMVDASIPEALATTQLFMNKFTQCLLTEANRVHPEGYFSVPRSEICIASNLKKILEVLHPYIPKDAMHLYRLAGFNKKVHINNDNSKDRKDYDRVRKRLSRTLNEFMKSNRLPPGTTHIAPIALTATAPSPQPAEQTNIHGYTIAIPHHNEDSAQLLSPMTNSQRTSTDSSTLSSLSSSSQQLNQEHRSETRSHRTTTIRSQRQRAITSTVDDSSTQRVDIFGDQIPRQSSMQAQSSRRYDEKEKKTREIGHILGTILYNEKEKGNNVLSHLQSADEVADGMNRLLGIEVINGHEIKKAVEENHVGRGPKPRGRPTEVPKEDIEDLALLFFSITSIEQNNGGKRLKRPQLISLLDQIVNSRRRRERKKELDATNLYKYHIEPLNSLRQDMNIVDRREFIRVLWLTYKNLLQNYERWEEVCVREGFARWSESEDEFQEHGKIVFIDGKYSNRFWNFDEMKLSLDQTSERAGGRPANTPTNPAIADPGEGEWKSGMYCTVVASIIGNEPGVPLFIFPSQSKSGEVNVHAKRLDSFPQIHAKYGNTSQRYYDVNIQYSTKGSMTKSIMASWVQGFSEYYPDVADENGKRVMLKSDFGPGRLQNEEAMTSLLIDGFKFFGSVPNGTEITQEMDQLFSEFKRLCYANRDQLIAEVINAHGSKATFVN